MKFRPTLWPTVVSIPAFIVLLGLGTWQVQRLHWKEQLIAERTARTTAAPIALPKAGQALSTAALDDLDFRRASVQGEFRHDQEMYLAARTMEGSYSARSGESQIEAHLTQIPAIQSQCRNRPPALIRSAHTP